MNEYPSDWGVRQLGEIAERVNRTSVDQSLEVLTISSTEGWVEQRRKWARDMAGKSIEKYTLLKKGEFSYNRGNSKTYPQGCVFRLESWGQALVPNVYHSFSITSSDMDGTFLQHHFAAGGLNSQLRRVITSSVRDNGLLNITADTFFSLEVPLPPLREQKKIAEILSSLDSCIFKNTIKARILTTTLEMLSSQILNEISRDPSCKSMRIDEISTLKGGNAFPLEHQGITSGGIPFIKVSDFNTPGNETLIKTANNYLDEKSMSAIRPFIFPGDTVVFAKVGAALTSNRRRILGMPTCIDNNLMGAIPRDIEPLYLKLLLEKVDFNQFCQDGAVPSVNQSQIGRIKVPVPSRDKQREIIELTESFRENQRALEKKTDSLNTLRYALSSDLLSGRKRVSV